MSQNKITTFIIALVSKTSSGKDTCANYIKKEYGIEPIVSFTTREMRKGEVNGREHYFITKDEMSALLQEKDNILAYVKFPKTGIEYCASTYNITENQIRTYIIDPSGLDWLRKNRPDVKVISIYLHLDENLIRERALKRGDKPELIEERLDSEREMFNTFYENHGYDECIDTNKSKEEIYAEIDSIFNKYGIKRQELIKK